MAYWKVVATLFIFYLHTVYTKDCETVIRGAFQKHL